MVQQAASGFRAVTVTCAGIVAAVATAVVVAGKAAALWARRATWAFDDTVVALAVGVLLVLTVWLGTAVTLTALAESGRLGRRVAGGVARACTPHLVRLLVRAVCGVAVAAGPALFGATAGAAPDEGLPPPDRPGSARTPGITPKATPGATRALDPAQVRVRPGDTLWAIAARHLPRDAGAAEIAAAWPEWFAHNRDRVGPDPDLIYPGTELTVPGPFRQHTDAR